MYLFATNKEDAYEAVKNSEKSISGASRDKWKDSWNFKDCLKTERKTCAIFEEVLLTLKKWFSCICLLQMK